MDLTIDVVAAVTEREELLNGTNTVTFAGESEDGRWSVAGAFSWNLGLIDFRGEGDLVATSADDGSELFATLAEATPRAADAGDGDGDLALALTYDVDGGSGRYEGAAGRGSANVVLAGDEVRGRWVLALTLP